MAFTMVAWSESVPATTAVQDITAVPDDHVTVQGDNIVVPELDKLAGAYPVGLDIQNVQMVSPSLRTFILDDVAPVENAALPVVPPQPWDRSDNPMKLQTDEQLRARVGNSNVGAQQESVIALLSDGPISPIKGENIHTVLCTATHAAVAYAWDNAPLVFTQDLPVGTYKIVGIRCEQANAIAFRLVFVGGIWRPGHLAVNAINAIDPPGSRFGQMGVWGTFTHLRPPTIDFFGDGTGGAARLYLDLVKV